MSNGISSIISTGFGRQQPQENVPLTYEEYLTLALNDLIDGTFSYRDPDAFPSEGIKLLRLVPSAYADGLNTPSGASRPSPRLISTAVCDQAPETKILNPTQCTDMFWLWGQFVDHDLDLTETGATAFNISVPTGDTDFDPTSTGTVEIPLTRSVYDDTTGTGIIPREQLNLVTQYLDATNTYGSTTARCQWLRTYKNGKLKSGMGNMLPNNDGTVTNAGPAGKNPFVAGDVRGNENVALLSMHTLLMREHNWWCTKIKEMSPNFTDEQIYQRARIVVEAEVQRITYDEFLPLLLGEDAIPEYTGYDDGVDAQIANEFSTGAYRLGHSLISETLLRLKNDETNVGTLTLKDALFAPHYYTNDGDIDYILRGFCRQQCQKIDRHLVDSLRNFLFGEPGSGGLDLASLNIQRGRDHGLPDYNTMRDGLGLGTKATFADISSDTAVATALSTAYGGDISKVDMWVGGLCEDVVTGSQLGELFHHIVKDQFIRTRDGDELWYENRLTKYITKLVHKTTLATILKRNTKIRNIKNQVMKL